MKIVSTDALTKLIQLIKSNFISVNDTVTATTVELADVATTGDYEDLINTPNYGAGLSYSNSQLQLLDQDGNNLGNPVTISGGGTSAWGSITGTLSNQTDLQNALDDKVEYAMVIVDYTGD